MISKIEGPGSVRSTSTVKRTAKSSGASETSFAKHLDETDETSGTSGVSGTNSISGVLGVQEVDDATAHASRGKLRAQDILDQLEDLRIQLLTGAISREKLMQLTKMVSNRRANVTDPRLSEILDEIDLRAQVELAKYASSAG